MNLVAHYELQMLQIMLIRFQFIERERGGGGEREFIFILMELITKHFT